ncbi:protein of unknown function [Candidatus Hydrogenisulfobacillus filiaventi]|uniref:Uncharacterized protein n=1 Tax=Candidatus Hydrogenisulfobacillus filiaventi TaxID=2707344 RepID=A0A6F8ZGI4_9FIRM|nr:DUF4264 family protein [Bacillota bacterium]CAB1128746.1 protein of unknown function [Candidatus Hydrogenisulfobacillus filiaventi]
MEGRKAEPLQLAARHEKLMILGQRRFTNGFSAYQVVTFLNQVLKERGFIVGLRQIDEDFELTIYDAARGGSGPRS